MKKLLYFPVIHNQTDLGSLGSELSAEGEKKYGSTNWETHLQDVENSWDRVEAEIFRLLGEMTYNKIKIYQDGLPVDGEIGLKIIQELVSKGSKNYKIIDKLISNGAQIVTAENRDILIQEYNLVKDIINSTTEENQIKAQLIYKEMANEILDKRDNHIAKTINATLEEDEIGIAFFGAMHSVVDKLNEDITVTKLDMFFDRRQADFSQQNYNNL